MTVSLLHRRDPEAPLREALRQDSLRRQEDARETVGRLTFLTESLRKQNETNHFAQRLQAAYGMGFQDGAAQSTS